MLVIGLGTWALCLVRGTAMIMHPELGTSIRTTSAATPTDFFSAMYAAGSSLTIVGTSNFEPRTCPLQLVYLFNSLIGMSTLSLVLTYLMQIYSALRERKSMGLHLHLFTANTGDAAEMIKGLGPQGQFATSYTILAELAAAMAGIKESHHFYPVLFYFRFRPLYYSVSMITMVLLDTATLIKTALDDERYRWLKDSASVGEIWNGCILLLASLEETFLTAPELDRPDAQTVDRWRRRYLRALSKFRQAAIETTADDERGADLYLSLREQWDGYVARLVPALFYSMKEIDPAETVHPEPGLHTLPGSTLNTDFFVRPRFPFWYSA